MPAVPRIRVDGYVRVSRVGKRRGPRFISPAVQREAIEDWAARRGFELAEIFEELDASGSRADRPLLELAIRRLEYRATSALVVWRVDRFGRNLDAEERARRASGLENRTLCDQGTSFAASRLRHPHIRSTNR